MKKILTWQNLDLRQQPNWNNNNLLNTVIKQLTSFPPLVFSEEIRNLKQSIAKVAKGDGLVLQGGDCAETFASFNANKIRDKLKILLQMSLIVKHGTTKNVVKIGRIAGQYAKPRTNNFEVRDNQTLPSYRGDAINKIDFTAKAREHDCERLITAYYQSSTTLNIMRDFTSGGYAGLEKLQNIAKFNNSEYTKKYQAIVKKLSDSIRFINKIGVDSNNSFELKSTNFFTSHEALILSYEDALTRFDTKTKKWYDHSAHMLWVGHRTNFKNSSHINFLAEINNPIGIKIGPETSIIDLKNIIKKLNPKNEWGRLSLICRFGEKKIKTLLPKIIKIIKKNHFNVLWMCDPMHGNTFKTNTGVKTRHFNSILNELDLFFLICKQKNCYPGGIHFEFTEQNVTECLGGSSNIKQKDLNKKYESACDPRLNNEQSIEMSFFITELIKKNKF